MEFIQPYLYPVVTIVGILVLILVSLMTLRYVVRVGEPDYSPAGARIHVLFLAGMTMLFVGGQLIFFVS